MTNEERSIPEERDVGGLRCMQVLDVLDGWAERELQPNVHERVVAHVTECQACARFGARYAATIEALRNVEPVAAAGLKDRVLAQIS